MPQLARSAAADSEQTLHSRTRRINSERLKRDAKQISDLICEEISVKDLLLMPMLMNAYTETILISCIYLGPCRAVFGIQHKYICDKSARMLKFPLSFFF